MPKYTTERYVPDNSTLIDNAEAKALVYTYELDGKPIAISYSGKRKKSDFHVRFQSVEKRDEHIKGYFQTKINTINANIAFKAEQKARQEAEFKTLQIGDVFHCGWGYEQTQCDFYVLTEIKGKTGTFQEVNTNTVPGSEGMDCDRRTADVNSLVGAPFKKRLNGSSFKLSSFQYVSKCEPDESFYCSWYY